MSAALLIVVPTGPFSMLSTALVDDPRSGGPKWLDSPLIGLPGYGSFGGADLRKDTRTFPVAAIAVAR
ncbi:MAG TPA: hypothetical protein VJ351_11530 [Streptosporangiaceae bacterium]|jgi:hypothetical protein|nr:hypothetical protein [Streptosporangiaceae bacterium]